MKFFYIDECEFVHFDEAGAWVEIRTDRAEVEADEEIAVCMTSGGPAFWTGNVMSWDMGSDFTLRARHPVLSAGLEDW